MPFLFYCKFGGCSAPKSASKGKRQTKKPRKRLINGIRWGSSGGSIRADKKKKHPKTGVLAQRRGNLLPKATRCRAAVARLRFYQRSKYSVARANLREYKARVLLSSNKKSRRKPCISSAMYCGISSTQSVGYHHCERMQPVVDDIHLR